MKMGEFYGWPKRDENAPVIVVCQGDPRCSLTGQAAIDAQLAGCQWCERIYPDGTTTKPGEA